jgi:hypothetical protein
MSMINDALRRASSAAKTPGEAAAPLPLPAAPPLPIDGVPLAPPLPPMATAIPAPPVMRVAPIRKKSSLPIVLGALFFFGLAATAGVYFWKKAGPLPVMAVESNAAGQGSIKADGQFSPDAIPVQEGSAAIAGVPRASNAAPRRADPVPKPVTTTAVAAAPIIAVPVKFPPLRLQSIFYRPTNPSVIINGKTLFLGDEINGVRVADIQPSSVTLMLSGQTNVLTLR